MTPLGRIVDFPGARARRSWRRARARLDRWRDFLLGLCLGLAAAYLTYHARGLW